METWKDRKRMDPVRFPAGSAFGVIAGITALLHGKQIRIGFSPDPDLYTVVVKSGPGAFLIHADPLVLMNQKDPLGVFRSCTEADHDVVIRIRFHRQPKKFCFV